MHFSCSPVIRTQGCSISDRFDFQLPLHRLRGRVRLFKLTLDKCDLIYGDIERHIKTSGNRRSSREMRIPSRYAFVNLKRTVWWDSDAIPSLMFIDRIAKKYYIIMFIDCSKEIFLCNIRTFHRSLPDVRLTSDRTVKIEL